MIFNMTEEDWDSVIAVHLKGTFNTCRHGASYWRSRRDPAGHFRIINFTSGSGLFGSPGQSNYAAAKMGIVGLTYSCANALRRYGVTVNAIAPGALTRMGASVPQDRQVAPGVKEEPLPAHVATVVGYLAATRSDWLTGRIIGSLGHAITLYSDPTTQSELVSDEPWTVESAGRALERVFMPIVSHTNPLFEDQIRRAEGGGVR
jgi:NAD(P)-dependent dehydrogenase (short-subunit alcohol dehydrogenase family)